MAVPDIDLAKQVCRIDGAELEDFLEACLEGATDAASAVARVDYRSVEMPANVQTWVLATAAHWFNNPDAQAKQELSPALDRMLDSVRKWDIG